MRSSRASSFAAEPNRAGRISAAVESAIAARDKVRAVTAVDRAAPARVIVAARVNWVVVAAPGPRTVPVAVPAAWAEDQVVAVAPFKAPIAAAARRAAPAVAAAPAGAAAAVELREVAVVVGHAAAAVAAVAADRDRGLVFGER